MRVYIADWTHLGYDDELILYKKTVYLISDYGELEDEMWTISELKKCCKLIRL